MKENSSVLSEKVNNASCNDENVVLINQTQSCSKTPKFCASNSLPKMNTSQTYQAYANTSNNSFELRNEQRENNDSALNNVKLHSKICKNGILNNNLSVNDDNARLNAFAARLAVKLLKKINICVDDIRSADLTQANSYLKDIIKRIKQFVHVFRTQTGQEPSQKQLKYIENLLDLQEHCLSHLRCLESRELIKTPVYHQTENLHRTLKELIAKKKQIKTKLLECEKAYKILYGTNLSVDDNIENVQILYNEYISIKNEIQDLKRQMNHPH